MYFEPVAGLGNRLRALGEMSLSSIQGRPGCIMARLTMRSHPNMPPVDRGEIG